MAIGMQDFTHTFFSAVTIADAAGTINWASAETTPTNYASASTEKVDIMGLKISVTFAAAATGDTVIHFRKNSDTILHTETLRIEAPGTTTAQVREYFIYGLFNDLDVGVENEDAAQDVVVTITAVDGTKLTGVTAAA